MIVLFHGTFCGVRIREVKRLQVQSNFYPDCPLFCLLSISMGQGQNYHINLRGLCNRNLYRQFHYSWEYCRDDGHVAWGYTSSSTFTYRASAFLL